MNSCLFEFLEHVQYCIIQLNMKAESRIVFSTYWVDDLLMEQSASLCHANVI